MSRGQSSAETLYLRPLSAQPPTTYRGAARYLVKHGHFRDYKSALAHLTHLFETDQERLRGIFASYYQEVDPPKRIHMHARRRDWRSTSTNLYGEDPHMYF